MVTIPPLHWMQVKGLNIGATNSKENFPSSNLLISKSQGETHGRLLPLKASNLNYLSEVALFIMTSHTQPTVGTTQKPLLELPQRQLYQTEVVAAKTAKPQLPTPTTTTVTQSTQGEPEPRASAAATGASAQDGQGQKKG